MTTQHWIWTAAGAMLGLALIAGVADWRRVNRRTIHGWGWMPWRGVQAAAFFAAMALAVFSLRG